MAEFGRELHALRLAARERGRRLSELDVAEAHVAQALEHAPDLRVRLEEADRVLDRRLEDVGDRLAAVADLERLARVALPLAGLAGDEDVGQEVHLDLLDALALARLAAPALHVEREAAGLVSADLRLGNERPDAADLVEDARVGRGVRPRRAADRRLVDLDDARDRGESLDARAVGRRRALAGDLRLRRREEDVVHERRLARTRHARDADDPAEREVDVDLPQVVRARALHRDRARGVERTPPRGWQDRAATREVLAGEARRMRGDAREVARGDERAAVAAGAGADVEDPVGRAHHVLVVLDDDDGVARVREAAQRSDEAVVVALVEADRRFVEHVADADEPRADLRREADPLRLAARERRARPVEREVLEADRREEPEARLDLLEDRPRDLPRLVREFEGARRRERARDRHPRDVGDREAQRSAAHLHRETLGAEPPPLADGAARLAHVGEEALLHALALGLGRAALEVGEDALPLEAEADAVGVAAAHEAVARPFGELAVRRVEVDLRARREEPELPRVPDVHPPAVPPPRVDRLAERLRPVGDDERLVELVHRAEAGARGARALRRVEAEDARLELVERAFGVLGAGELLAEAVLGPAVLRRGILDQDGERPLRELERRLDALGDPLARRVLDRDPVDDRVDVVLLVAAETEGILAAVLQDLAEVDDLPVRARAHEALLRERLEHLAVEALLRADDRRAEHRAPAREAGEQRLDDLARTRRGDLAAAEVDRLRTALPRLLGVPAGGRPAAREEEAQVVPDLGRGRHDRARAVAARALLDRDRRWQPLDRLDVRLLHLVEELARVRGERLHVLALALREDRVEGERALAASRDARDHDQPVAGDLAVERLEVVFTGATDADRLVGKGHGGADDRARRARVTDRPAPHIRPGCASEHGHVGRSRLFLRPRPRPVRNQG